MNVTRWLSALFVTTLAWGVLVLTPTAAADGLPMVNLDTSEIGIENRDGDISYYALPRGDDTEVLRTGGEPDKVGRTLTRRTLDGTLAIPGVAWDGTTSGLSSLGGRLVLIEPRQTFPRRSTRLVVLDATSLGTIAEIDLDGDFSFDAVSPDGGLIYLINYFDPKDPSVYEVRAWDVEAEQLLPEPIIDERIAPRVMRGYPMTRATSPDGNWEYTLYDGLGKPFVHALNTADSTALCVDLPMLENRGVNGYGLVPSEDGSSVAVTNRGGAEVSSFTTGDWVATGAASDSAHVHDHATSQEAGFAATPWLIALAALAGIGMLAWAVRRGRKHPV
jgi:hypothetical protein